jgi:hypothetical protein
LPVRLKILFQENITQLLGKYYTTKARFPMDFPEKQVNNDISIYRLFGHLKIVINVSQYKNIFNPDI